MTNVSLDYEFQELQPFPGYEVYVSGVATIAGEYAKPDYETGFPGGWSYYVETISLGRHNRETPQWFLSPADQLWEGLEQALCGPGYSESIVEHLEESIKDVD